MAPRKGKEAVEVKGKEPMEVAVVDRVSSPQNAVLLGTAPKSILKKSNTKSKVKKKVKIVEQEDAGRVQKRRLRAKEKLGRAVERGTRPGETVKGVRSVKSEKVAKKAPKSGIRTSSGANEGPAAGAAGAGGAGGAGIAASVAPAVASATAIRDRKGAKSAAKTRSSTSGRVVKTRKPARPRKSRSKFQQVEPETLVIPMKKWEQFKMHLHYKYFKVDYLLSEALKVISQYDKKQRILELMMNSSICDEPLKQKLREHLTLPATATGENAGGSRKLHTKVGVSADATTLKLYGTRRPQTRYVRINGRKFRVEAIKVGTSTGTMGTGTGTMGTSMGEGGESEVENSAGAEAVNGVAQRNVSPHLQHDGAALSGTDPKQEVDGVNLVHSVHPVHPIHSLELTPQQFEGIRATAAYAEYHSLAMEAAKIRLDSMRMKRSDAILKFEQKLDQLEIDQNIAKNCIANYVRFVIDRKDMYMLCLEKLMAKVFAESDIVNKQRVLDSWQSTRLSHADLRDFESLLSGTRLGFFSQVVARPPQESMSGIPRKQVNLQRIGDPFAGKKVINVDKKKTKKVKVKLVKKDGKIVKVKIRRRCPEEAKKDRKSVAADKERKEKRDYKVKLVKVRSKDKTHAERGHADKQRDRKGKDDKEKAEKTKTESEPPKKRRGRPRKQETKPPDVVKRKRKTKQEILAEQKAKLAEEERIRKLLYPEVEKITYKKVTLDSLLN